MLFEIALNAIVDGYNREAVSSFSATRKRFFEFAVRVIANKHDVPSDVFAETWKIASEKSERQLGAYVFLYLAEFKAAPRLLSNKMTELRNDVVHKVNCHTAKNTRFWKSSLRVIQESIHQLRTTHLDQVNKVLGERVARIVKRGEMSIPARFR